MKKKLISFCITPILCMILSCSGGNESEKVITKNSDTTDTSTPSIANAPSVKGAIVNIQDSIEIEQTVLCLKDSSSTIEGMYQKLSNIYNVKLQETITAGKLTIMGSPMAWQSKQKEAFFFEAGIPVDRAPSKMGKGMYMKSTGDDSAAVAHFWGPQNLTKSAYDALTEKLADVKKTKSADVYEIYRGNYFPANNEAVDFYKLQTDIIMPFKGTIAPKEKEAKPLKYSDKEMRAEAKNSKKKSKQKAKTK